MSMLTNKNKSNAEIIIKQNQFQLSFKEAKENRNAKQR